MKVGSDKCCVGVFVKYPREGYVKTRLGADVTGLHATELYRLFVCDTISLLENEAFEFHLCFSPESSRKKFEQWLGDSRVLVPQRGADLGERMKNAFIEAFEYGFVRVIVIGSDSPDLPPDFLSEGFDSLRNYDAVIGPCDDGGYYLIGFRADSFASDVFCGIDWSSSEVFGQTMSVFANLRLTVHQLPSWHDVDTVDDVRHLVERNRKTEFFTSRTMEYVLSHEGVFGV